MANTPLRYLGQALGYVVFVGLVGYFSNSPAYTHLAADQALIKLSFSHKGQRIAECRQRSAEELAKLAPNMRVAMDCPRERSPITVELELDGQLVHQQTLKPTGLSRDGVSYLYKRFPVLAGEHHLTLRLRDSVHIEGFNYERVADVDLAPAQVLVIDFNPEQGGFIIK